jgi:CheY-like chemotaxis protein
MVLAFASACGTVTVTGDAMHVLVLDDSNIRLAAFRVRFPEATLVKTAEEAVAALDADPDYDYVYLDHDLGPGEDGLFVARHITTMPKHDFQVVVHSHAGSRAKEMVLTLRDAGVHAILEPFTISDKELASIAWMNITDD